MVFHRLRQKEKTSQLETRVVQLQKQSAGLQSINLILEKLLNLRDEHITNLQVGQVTLTRECQ